MEMLPQLRLTGAEGAHTDLGLLSLSVVQGWLLVESWLQGGLAGKADLLGPASPELGKGCSAAAAVLGTRRG